jgi:hypothetical protein
MADGRFALIVANSRYADATLSQLRAPVYDADSLAQVLGDPAVGDFEVKMLIDRPAVEAMQEIETFFDGRRRDDLVLFYFSGHGILDQGARLYFATTNTRVDRPRSTAIAAAFVSDLMSECRSRRQVLMLDCCNSGSFGRGVKAGGNIGTGERFEGRGRVVITASDALQYAFEGGKVEGEGVRSVFTQALVDGLKTGDADLDGDGYVTLDELYDYVYGRIVDASPRQRPGKWAFGVEGRIFIARTTPSAQGRSPSTSAIPAAPAPPAKRTGGARAKLLATPQRKLMFGAAALLVAGAIAAGSVLLTSGSPSAGTGASSFSAQRNATLAVYRAWQGKSLATLSNQQISRAARSTLAQMPAGPVAPNPAKPGDCYGTSGNVTCVYGYPGLGIELHFNVLGYPGGPRVDSVICRSTLTSKRVKGGIAACARVVRHA